MTGNTQAALWYWIDNPRKKAQAWGGFCNGWAAGSVLEKEPTAPLEVRDAKGNSLWLSVGDQSERHRVIGARAGRPSPLGSSWCRRG